MIEPYLVFRATKAALAALPARHVRETMRPLAIERLAGTPPFVLGAAIVRGVTVPVVDAAALLGGITDAATRWIMIDVGARSVVLAAREVVGVRILAVAPNEGAPPLFANAARGAIEALGMLDGELLAILRTARIVSDDVALDAMGTAHAH